MALWRIDAVVGVYTWSGLRAVRDVLYLASISGGTPRRSIEAWTSRLVGPDDVPRTVFPWMRQRITDAFVSDDHLGFTLPATLRAGAHGVQIVHESHRSINQRIHDLVDSAAAQ